MSQAPVPPATQGSEPAAVPTSMTATNPTSESRPIPSNVQPDPPAPTNAPAVSATEGRDSPSQSAANTPVVQASATAVSTSVAAGNAGTSSSSAAASAAFRPLNVRDALNYLDRVKQQFSQEYAVYDQFLTIMKEFKTQAIDTPGVIDRVSSLFRGHPSLIQGFNTFLPPGYRIECTISTNTGDGPRASNTITVTTPMGVTTRTQDVNGTEAREFVNNNPGTAAGVAPASSRPGTPETFNQQKTNLTGQRNGATSLASSGQNTPIRRVSPPAPIPPYQGNKSAQAHSGPNVTPAAWKTQPSANPAARAHPNTAMNTQSISQPVATVGRALDSVDHRLTKANIEASNAAAEAPIAGRANLEDSSAVASTGGQVPAAAAAPATTNAPPIMEFNHAINYVNKIKNRFVKDPETYKTFLEILQTYQKETRPIQEVYTQVTALFHSAPDLLDEFKAFLPDTSDPTLAQNAAQGQAGTTAVRKGPGMAQPKSSKDDARSGLAAKKPLLEEKKKRAAPGMGERAKAKKAKISHSIPANEQIPQHAQQPQQANTVHQNNKQDRFDRTETAAVPPSVAHYHPQPYGAPPPGFPGAPRFQSAYDAYLAEHRQPQLVQPEEFGFFDRVKKYLDDRTAYTEFLKLLNLFTQEIIDLPTLLEKSLLFFGQNDELVQQLKDLVGYDPVTEGRIPGEDWVIDNEPAGDRPNVLLHLMKKFGPSYRKLPESEIDLACSGRDALDWSVLNDEWVAYATWASEGSSAQRKNVYEEALYNSEQERHWYSVHIESIARTISHLEPIAARISLMPADERLSFKLSPGLGGTAPSVYERIVKKVYGKDHGWEIMQALYENPSIAVPIVLSRLKQKDEEWKRAEKEWNKLWRELDFKNYYRALDHQGIVFKQFDKKATMTSKALTNEIETLKKEKQQKKFELDPSEIASTTSLRPHHQFELSMQDSDVMFDVLKLIFSFLDREQNSFSGPERTRVEAFLRMFIPLIFNIDPQEMEARIIQHEAEPEDRTAAENDDKSAKNVSVEPETRSVMSEHVSHGPIDLNLLQQQTWIQLSQLTADGQVEPIVFKELLPRRFNFFGNQTFYCLVRVFHTIYFRLINFKQSMKQLAETQPPVKRLSPLAVELGLSAPIADIDQGENPAQDFYEHALDLAEKLFDGEIEASVYEEELRYMAGIKAYPLFTLDKLISTIIKHIHTINSDPVCQDLVSLLQQDRKMTSALTARQQIGYRMLAEQSLDSSTEHLYRIEWIPSASTCTIQLLSKQDLTLDDAHADQEKLRKSWIASFTLPSATEGVGAKVSAPLLKRNRTLSAAHDSQLFDLQAGLEVRLSANGYKLNFVAGTEDFLFRKREAATQVGVESAVEALQVPLVTEGEDSASRAPSEANLSEVPDEARRVALPMSVVVERRRERFANWLQKRTGAGVASVEDSPAMVVDSV